MKREKMKNLTSMFSSLRKSITFMKRRYVGIVLAAVLVCLCEVIVFNLPFWQTASASPMPGNLTLGSGLARNSKGLKITNPTNAYLEVSGNAEPINYLYVDTYQENVYPSVIYYKLCTQQPNNTGWYSGDSVHAFEAGINSSQYIRVQGNTVAVRLQFQGDEGQIIPVQKIVVNPRIPFSISGLRLVLMGMLSVLCLVFRPHSRLFEVPLGTRRLSIRDTNLWYLTLFTVLQIAFLLVIWRWAGSPSVVSRWPRQIFAFHTDYDQYARLADALIHGKTSLDLPVSDALRSMPNPYDADLRGEVANSGGGPVYWDHAFYKGNYYSYFGVVPAVLFYVPFQLLTGRWLPTTWLVLALGIVTAIIITILVVQVARVYFANNVSVGTLMIAIAMMNVGSSLYYQVFTPNFYSVPGLCALFCAMAAISCWLKAKQRDKISRTFISLGSLLMALTLGCRPQFILISILALPLFWNELFRHRLFFSRKSIGNTIAAFAPFIVVFIPLLSYNKIRFGDWLDFGANYNLTGFDMTVMHTPKSNFLPLVWYYLFQPMNITGVFPYVGKVQTPLPLWSPVEPSIGGLFAIYPFFIMIFLAFWVFRGKVDASIRRVLWSSVVLAAVILVVDAYMCGIAWRYYLDFSWLLSFVAIFVLMRLGQLRHDQMTGALMSENVSKELLKTVDFSRILFFASAWCVIVSEIIQFFALFMNARMNALIEVNPYVYFDVAQWFLAF